MVIVVERGPADLRDTSALRASVDNLRLALLPTVRPEEVPSPAQSTRTHAFLILTHAAIEEFLELGMLSAVRSAIDPESNRVHAIAICLSIKFRDEIVGQENTGLLTPGRILRKLAPFYEEKITKPNNGLRTRNLEKMCKPLGIDITTLADDIDIALASLDTLGSKRGLLAHTDSWAATEVIHPTEADKWVDDAINGLESIGLRLASTLGL